MVLAIKHVSSYSTQRINAFMRYVCVSVCVCVCVCVCELNICFNDSICVNVCTCPTAGSDGGLWYSKGDAGQGH